MSKSNLSFGLKVLDPLFSIISVMFIGILIIVFVPMPNYTKLLVILGSLVVGVILTVISLRRLNNKLIEKEVDDDNFKETQRKLIKDTFREDFENDDY